MPWKVVNIVNERIRFVVRLQSGERMIDLCREFGVSRKTGYKIVERFRQFGAEGLFDRSRAPCRQWQRTATEIEDKIEGLRKQHPTWGPKKLKKVLSKKHPGVKFPAESTFAQILKRRGLVSRRPRRHTAKPTPANLLTRSRAPNDVWVADFKGQFRLGNQQYCYPLTISDDLSRYFIACEALEHTRGLTARSVFVSAFRRFGLPTVIRTDNGAPFASTGLYGLTPLSVWWMRLGIRVERIEPGHPEQNGRHERLHLTLKQETTRPAAGTFLQQQERFDRFMDEYNRRRPHEALAMRCPAEVYTHSKRPYVESLPELVYPTHDMVRVVRHNGVFRFRHRGLYLNRALAGQEVGLREVDHELWLISFMHLDLGYLDSRKMEFLLEPNEIKAACSSNAVRKIVLPM